MQAALTRRVEVFDRRQLATGDGFRGAKSWLQAACRLSGVVAHRLVRASRLLRDLPKLAEAFQAGEVPAETVQQVVRLAEQVGAERVAEIEPTLADAAGQLDPAGFAVVCERVRASGTETFNWSTNETSVWEWSFVSAVSINGTYSAVAEGPITSGKYAGTMVRQVSTLPNTELAACTSPDGMTHATGILTWTFTSI